MNFIQDTNKYKQYQEDTAIENRNPLPVESVKWKLKQVILHKLDVEVNFV